LLSNPVLHEQPAITLIVRLVNVRYQAVVKRDREEVELLLRGNDEQQIGEALLSAAYYDPNWRWVQGKCLASVTIQIPECEGSQQHASDISREFTINSI